MTTFSGFFKAQTWEKVTASIVDLSWLIMVYQGFDIIYSLHGTALDRGILSLNFDLCFCKVKIFRCYIYLVFASVATQCRIQILR